MKVAVTGAAGHLGCALCRLLDQAGHDLTRIDLLPLPPGAGEARQADLSDPDQARAALDGAEQIVHVASIHPWKTYPDSLYLDLNVKGTWNVYQAARELGVRRVVLTSSIAATGYHFPPELWPVTESHEGPPTDLYAFTKHAQEDIARHHARYRGVATIALRPPAFMPKDPLPTGVALLGCFALVDDIAAAHAAAVAAGDLPDAFEPFYITNKLPYRPSDAPLPDNLWELAERYHPGVTAWFAERGEYRFGLPAVYCLDKAERLLGWTPRHNFEQWWAEQQSG